MLQGVRVCARIRNKQCVMGEMIFRNKIYKLLHLVGGTNHYNSSWNTLFLIVLLFRCVQFDFLHALAIVDFITRIQRHFAWQNSDSSSFN